MASLSWEVGVNVLVQVIPPSPLLTVVSVPLTMLKSVLLKSVTASEKVMVTSEVSPALKAVSATTITTVGAVMSIVADKPEEALLALPAVSVAFAVIVCEPSLSVEAVMLQLPLPSAVVVPSDVVPSVSYTVTIALASAVPVKVGVLSDV